MLLDSNFNLTNELPDINHLTDNASFNVDQFNTMDTSLGNIYQPSSYFDSSSGVLTVNSNAPVSTNSLNTQNLYNLLIKLQEDDKLKLNNDSLTSQFYLSSNELNSLLEPNQIKNLNNYNQEIVNSEHFSYNFMYQDSISQSNIDFNTEPLQPVEVNLQAPANFQCQELCCLLKFTPLDGDLL